MPPTPQPETFTCPTSKDTFPRIYGIESNMMVAGVVKGIKQEHPSFDGADICETCHHE